MVGSLFGGLFGGKIPGAGDLIYDSANDRRITHEEYENIRRIGSMSMNPPSPYALGSANTQPAQPVQGAPGVYDYGFRQSLLRMRMRVSNGESLPFEDLMHSVSGEKVYVFVVQNGQAVTLEDTISLFPSDTLITQLGLLRK